MIRLLLLLLLSLLRPCLAQPDPGACLRAVSVRQALAQPATFTCFGAVDSDGSRWVLGTDSGAFYLLVVGMDGSGKVLELTLEHLGQTSTATAVVYLDAGVVYVGSAFGDSQVGLLYGC